MENNKQKWIYLGLLALIWGSSFILMKKALQGITPIQLGALRISITALFLMLIGIHKLWVIKGRHWLYLLLNGFLGTFFPAFLYAYALSHIDSSIASILNSFTPLNTMIVGALVFGFSMIRKQVIGVFVGLGGSVMLILEGADINPDQNYFFALFIIAATVGYAFNVNIIKKYLYDLDALAIAVGNFVLMLIPAVGVLWWSDFFLLEHDSGQLSESLIYVIVLAVVGTGIAKILFNKLVHVSTPVFSSSVTYLIPVVAIAWGIWDGERISLLQVLGGAIILFGVYLVNNSK